MIRYPAVSAVLLYYAVTFGVVLSVFPAYMGDSSLSNQNIEYLFFVFGVSRFATLYFVPRISKYGKTALAMAVAATAMGMLIAFASSSIAAFAASMVLIGVATSIFYPVTLGMITKNTPPDQMGRKLGAYEAMFGLGWAIGPLAVGISSDSFGSSTPYLGLFFVGSALAVSLVTIRRR
jgi:DHA1 family multidrug resistance protein-like MFS transporter/DHA1 family quinolone resistance protein-like MFS transporter